MSSPKEVEKEAPAKRLCVLKFGSSVLEREEDYPKVVHEIYRHVRNGEKVVAVVSALAVDGFTSSFAVPAVWLAATLALGAVAGVVAAVRPAHRAARMDVLAAIAME